MTGKCTCLEVFGEDPNCAQHGIGTDYWADSIVGSPVVRAGVARECRAYHGLILALRFYAVANDDGKQARDALVKAGDTANNAFNRLALVAAGSLPIESEHWLKYVRSLVNDDTENGRLFAFKIFETIIEAYNQGRRTGERMTKER